MLAACAFFEREREREIEEEHRRIAFGEGSYELLYSETP
jgi:hypothetical protein